MARMQLARRSGRSLRPWVSTSSSSVRLSSVAPFDPRTATALTCSLAGACSENICDREDIVEANIRSVKISSPDYAGWDPDEAVKAYMGRIANHKKRYETIESSVAPFVKIYNVGERLVINNIRGYLQSRIVFFLMNVHHKKRTIWFARVRAQMLRSEATS